MFWLSLLILSVVISLAEAFLHYFPWKLVLMGESLPRPAAYVLGVSAFMVPLSVWMLVYGYVIAVIVMWVAVGVAGVTVLMVYFIDYVIDLAWHKIESIEREHVHAKK